MKIDFVSLRQAPFQRWKTKGHWTFIGEIIYVRYICTKNHEQWWKTIRKLANSTLLNILEGKKCLLAHRYFDLLSSMNFVQAITLLITAQKTLKRFSRQESCVSQVSHSSSLFIIQLYNPTRFLLILQARNAHILRIFNRDPIMVAIRSCSRNYPSQHCSSYIVCQLLKCFPIRHLVLVWPNLPNLFCYLIRYFIEG